MQNHKIVNGDSKGKYKIYVNIRNRLNNHTH